MNRRPQQGQRIVRLVRALTAVGLLAGAFTIGMIGWTLVDVRAKRSQALVEQEALNGAVREIRTLGTGAENEMAIDESGRRAGDAKPVGRLAQFIRTELDDQRNAAVREPLRRINSRMAELELFSRRVNGWRDSYADVCADITQQRTIGRLRNLIAQLRSAVAGVQVRHRLDDAIKYRHWRNSAGADAAQQAQAILLDQSRRQNQDCTDFSNDLAELARMVEVLAGIEQFDRLSDLKENQLKPLLNRLSSYITTSDFDQEVATEVTPQAIANIRIALFGNGNVTDDFHQKIRLDSGGLFNLRQTGLQLRREEELLKAELSRLFDGFEADTLALAQSAQARSTALTQQMEQSLALGWRRGLTFGGVIAALFLWLAWLILRGVQRQVVRLETAHEITRLLANSGSLFEAAPKLLSTICDRVNWDYGGLWVVDAPAMVMRCLEASHEPDLDLDDFAKHSRQLTFAKGIGTPGRVWQSGQTTWISDVLRDSNFPRAPFAAKCGLHASMIFPVFLGGEVVAAFEFFSRGRRAFDDDVTLMMANIGKQVALLMERSRADESREAMHRELLEASHEAGMAEVATGILHNVGNVLNSVNISAQIVCDKLQHSRVSKLGLVAQMLTEHESDLPDFLSNDERGSQLPAYLCQLVDHLNGETRVISDEMDALAKNVDHIKEIVNTQQAYAGSGGFIETLDLRELLEDALRIYAASFARHDVTLICEIGDAPPICADKHKVLQILVNLIGNACQAMADAPVRKLTLRVMTTEIGGVRVSVRDTGYGILPENMTRIFSHAFTTKKDGHGFGLHSSALAAKELKGSLTVHSDGPGKGAIFTLELPPAIQEALIK